LLEALTADNVVAVGELDCYAAFRVMGLVECFADEAFEFGVGVGEDDVGVGGYAVED
jgi:hypothetical protein